MLHGDIDGRLGGGFPVVHDDFESYANTTEMRSAYDLVNPGNYDLETSTDVVEGSQSVRGNTSQPRMGQSSITTNDGDIWSVDFTFNSSGDMAGFHANVQDSSGGAAVLDDQIWVRLDFAGDGIECLIAEGGSYNVTPSSSISAMTAGNRYRVQLQIDGANSEAIVTVYEDPEGANTNMGSVTATYDTAWSSGDLILWAIDQNATVDYVRQEASGG